MKLFHGTDSSEAILEKGFIDATGTYLTDQEWSGVWLSDRVMVADGGAMVESTLVVEIPEEWVVEFEWAEEGKPYREFFVPAELVNRFGPPRVI